MWAPEQLAAERQPSSHQLLTRGLLSPNGFIDPSNSIDGQGAGHGAARGPLPLVQLLARSASATFCAASSADDRGRLADRTALKELGWAPGTAVSISMIRGAGVVVVRRDGPDIITRQGHLRLPARVRHGLRVRNGDRFLLLALVQDNVLIAYQASALDDMVTAYHAGITEQETR